MRQFCSSATWTLPLSKSCATSRLSPLCCAFPSCFSGDSQPSSGSRSFCFLPLVGVSACCSYFPCTWVHARIDLPVQFRAFIEAALRHCTSHPPKTTWTNTHSHHLHLHPAPAHPIHDSFAGVLNTLSGLKQGAGEGGQWDPSSVFITPAGVVGMLLYCLNSGFASVYSELIMKQNPEPFITQSIKMYFCGTVVNAVLAAVHAMLSHDDATVLSFVTDHTITRGFTPLTWAIVASQAINGMIYGFVLKVGEEEGEEGEGRRGGRIKNKTKTKTKTKNKNQEQAAPCSLIFFSPPGFCFCCLPLQHASNILRLFIVAVSMLLATLMSSLVFDAHVGLLFILSVLGVLCAVVLFDSSSNSQTSKTKRIPSSSSSA